MLRIVVFVPGVNVPRFFRDLPDDMRVSYCTARRDFVSVVRVVEPDAVVFAVGGAASSRCTALLPLVRQYAPACVIFVLTALTSDDARAAFQLASAGVDDVLFADVDSPRRLISVCSQRGDPRAAGERAWRMIADLTPACALPVVRCCIDNAGKRMTVARVAVLLGEQRTALANRLARAGCLPLQALIGWTTVLTAAVMLDGRIVSVEAVALKLELASAAALSNLTYRYAGVRPTEIRRLGVDEVVSRYALSARAVTRVDKAMLPGNPSRYSSPGDATCKQRKIDVPPQASEGLCDHM